MKICITGANGFIGNSICQNLSLSGYQVTAAVRFLKSTIRQNRNIEYIRVGEINSDTNWKKALSGCEYVIHCAGKVHEMSKESKYDEYKTINVDGTHQLAIQAAKAGVRRLIFLSTIKVNGEFTEDGFPFSSSEKINPKDFYSSSKYEAEQILWKVANQSGLEVVILRLPLVYGEGMKGNLKRLMKLINYNIPLPFKSIKNKRSLIGIDNLIDIIKVCIENMNAPGKTFLVSDGKDLSTPGLTHLLGSAMSCSPVLFSVPVKLLKFSSRIIGLKSEMERLTTSLQVDNGHVFKILNWIPPISVEEGIRRMVQGK